MTQMKTRSMNKSLAVFHFEHLMRIRLAQLIDEGNTMKKSYLSILSILMLTGCASPIHLLDKQGSAPFVGGELVHDRGEENLLVLDTSDRRYEARGFAVDRRTNLAELRKRYQGVNPGHWNRIFSSLDTNHVVYSIETTAKSMDGHEMLCQLAWMSRKKPAGVCTDRVGGEFPVHFE